MNNAINYLLIFVLFVSAFGCCYSQKPTEEQQVTEMLRQFYIAQSAIKSTPNDIGKMDSLQKLYCSKKLQKKLREQFQLTGLDHDLLTNDYGIDSLGVKTLSISKDSKQNNGYIVSYTILDDVVPNLSKKEIKVIINVTIQKEDDMLKVDDIK
ncbi:MAG: hypothetical protein QM786_19585 [Breznakibacter sp.]